MCQSNNAAECAMHKDCKWCMGASWRSLRGGRGWQIEPPYADKKLELMPPRTVSGIGRSCMLSCNNTLHQWTCVVSCYNEAQHTSLQQRSMINHCKQHVSNV